MKNQKKEIPPTMSDVFEIIMAHSFVRPKERSFNARVVCEPIPFDTVRLPDFPITAIPRLFRNYALALSTHMKAPLNMVGWQLLQVLSMAFATRYNVEAWPKYIQPIIFHTNAFVKSCEKKYDVFGAMIVPMHNYMVRGFRELGQESAYSTQEYEMIYMGNKAEATYHDALQRIFDNHASGVVKLSSKALVYCFQYIADVDSRLIRENEDMPDWGCKLVDIMLMIAGLIHCLKYDSPAEVLVKAGTVIRAIRIAEFLSSQPHAIYHILGKSSVVEDAKYLRDRITQVVDTPKISKHDLFCLCKERFETVNEMEPAMRFLAETHNILEHEVVTDGQTSVIININPLARQEKVDMRNDTL